MRRFLARRCSDAPTTGLRVVQELSPNPTVTVKVSTPPEIIRVEAREAGSPAPPLVHYVEPARYLGL